ncbi:pleiotropic drug resistance protein 3-like [Malania oleifera]|uniref:pleiotropic drug resistance protein 3-like n=1 Tax=Malania oleifera TaxID=397392 RepID=UPI0025AE4BC9|nr:pleiotropic drug resistance protein 3-like [Malania oleifera]
MDLTGYGMDGRSLSYRSSSYGESRSRRDEDDEELALQWAAIERLPTVHRLRTSLFDPNHDNKAPAAAANSSNKGLSTTDVSKLSSLQRQLFVEKLIRQIENDNLRLLHKLRKRIDRVGLELPTVEVRYENLSVEAKCEVVEGKPLPTLWNTVKSELSGLKRLIPFSTTDAKISILKDVSGVLKPSRLTLLLGPPGCGKTTFLTALAGKVNPSLKVTGGITYNGYKLDEFVPEKTAAYISQYDLHIPEMTVREAIDFSARCQGVGDRAEVMMEISRREKEAGIVPDPDIDTYMKAISVEGQEQTLQTDYVLKILGLDICADIMVGDAMRRGISGGQRKRLTTGEMIVGPTKALFMDEISTGLDSSTTFQIVTCLQQLVHITDATALVALLQPAPETFDLFDDVILMAEGKIVYHGPRGDALKFFEDCGFKCPGRKGAADFLQEVISRKDQAQYWYRTDLPYNYVTVDQFCAMFKSSTVGKKLQEELSKPNNKSQFHSNALSFHVYALGKWELFKACMDRELLLIKRNAFVYIFKTTQLVIIACLTMTVFIRSRMAVDLVHANYYMGVLFYTLVRLMTNGISELSLTISRLPVFYKQRDFYLYPAWAFSIPASMLKVPFALLESFLWTAVTYYVIGYDPQVSRFFRQFLLLFALHQASSTMCRFIASVCQTLVVATSNAFLVQVLTFLFGGYIIPRTELPSWLKWGFWVTPMSYGEIGISVNEFLAPRWQKVQMGNSTLGRAILTNHGLDFEDYMYWVSVGALFGFMILFDIGFALALTYLNPPGTSRAIISKKKLAELTEDSSRHVHVHVENAPTVAAASQTVAETRNGRMVLPFEPLAISFKDVQYFVDTPPEMRERGFHEKKLQLLHDITGAFRPGVLTALMGASGAGKTTLMDVLCGRKTGGTIEGDIRIGGYPKVQKTFARIAAYCEQTDIHSPQVTVKESVIFSAWLRLSQEIDRGTKARFIEEVIETVELDDIKDSLVGIPGQTGLSTEQRKRLTIAVELVSNPSIIFMDEPTSGLDARAAAIVMRAVKNVVGTGRTTVCTIHQPSIDIFEAFDELILMKRGGLIIYSGILGTHSNKLIQYFESIPGVPKIKDNYNPATWMLEVSSTSMEAELGVDFADIYNESSLCRETLEVVKELSEPPPGSRDLHFPSRFPQSGWEQFKACFWKHSLSYWRSPKYNVVRFVFMIAIAILFAAVFWQKAGKINNEQDLSIILGSMYIAVIFLGISNCSMVLPYVDIERTVLYREKFAGMYSSRAYTLAQVAIEVPYVLVQAFLYVAITYPTMGYAWSAYKVFWFFYATFCTFLYFTYLGMLMMSVSPNVLVASILSTAVYTILNLYSGFLMPGPKMPKWWVWLYWICPTAWSLNGLLTSQYGDEDRVVTIFGEPKTISAFLEDYYDFRHDRLGLVAVVLIIIPVVFACLFARSIAKLNFQKR